MLCGSDLVQSYITDFRSMISSKTSIGSSSTCSNTGFLEITVMDWSDTISFNKVVNDTSTYYNSMQCYWYIYNPYPNGLVELSFSSFVVSLRKSSNEVQGDP